MSDRLAQLDQRALRLNLYATQSLLLLAGVIGSIWQHGWADTLQLFTFPEWKPLALAVLLAGSVAVISIGLAQFLPAEWQDDGEISRKIFKGLSIPSVLLLCFYVGLSEEWLFRGAIQPLLGNGWTSLLFAVIHLRYLRKPMLLASVYGTSWLLGWLFAYSQGLLAPVIAHAFLDFFLALYIRWNCQTERSE